MNMFNKHFFIFSLSIFTISAASADIYQWRGNSGGIQFGNNPPKNNASVVLITEQFSSTQSNDGVAKETNNKQDSNVKVIKSSIFRNSRRNSLLYQSKDDNKDSRIISVRLLRESKNKLIFDVNYYLSEKIDGTANIGITPNMDNWSSVYTKALPGRHATTISVKLSDSTKSVIRSSSLKLSMALAKETGYVGSLFEHDLSFNKVWYKN
ncbi:MAG: DUF4124 domain-containing protein [Thiohalomonadales bacterium]